MVILNYINTIIQYFFVIITIILNINFGLSFFFFSHILQYLKLYLILNIYNLMHYCDIRYHLLLLFILIKNYCKIQ